MSLIEYKKKRDFKVTAEPTAKVARRKAAKLSYVVQKHAATRLHYDFRLELDGVLKSWAVPKGPSFDTSEKRLAVEVEDHPLDYARFEGRIPEGEYGAGEVIVWDRGTWTPQGDPHDSLRKGKLEFELKGKKLNGRWVLVRLGGRDLGPDKPNWLLIKRTDEFARPLSECDVLAEQPQSVKTGRTLEDLRGQALTVRALKKVQKRATRRAQGSRTAKSNGRARSRRKRTTKKRSPPAGASKASMPADIDVELAILEADVPAGNQWLHEIKFDGYRLIARIADGKVQLITRRHQDWTHRYRSIAEAAGALPVESAILDGELVVLLPTGVSSFQALQNAGKAGSDARLVYYVFDLLYLDGYDLRKLPLFERKEQLQAILQEVGSPLVQYSDHLDGDGRAFFRESCQLGLEGIISKRRDRPYLAGRTGDWVKVKCLGREELVIGGFTLSTADRRGIGAIIVGYYDKGDLVYAGRVGTGFNSHTLVQMRQRLEKLRTGECPFAAVPSKERGPMVKWVRPELVAEVQFGSWTDDGILRQPSFQGLREDKPAAEVTRPASLKLATGEANMPRSSGSRSSRSRSTKAKAAAQREQELPIEITHPERVLFAETGLTKLGLAHYYAQVAEWILPHIVDRPLSLVRCPEGHAAGKCFYQKHAGPGTPKQLGRVMIEESDGPEEYVYVRDLASLLSLVQMSVLEIHPWGAKRDNVERPDRLTIDLDPAPDVPWARVVEAAFAVRELLDKEYGLASFVKTTGGKGLHVVLPVSPRRYDWDAVKEFCKAVATRLAQSAPSQYTTNMAKAARKGRIFVDYLRNDRGATAVCAYSTRAKPGAPVSTPLAWDELSSAIRSDHFHVANLPARLASLKRDPWAGIEELRQGIGR
jgi:bifunctional non-homologous end joining protein LigD